MASINLKNLIGKLNETCHRALEAGAGLCLSRTNYDVEIEHWLIKLLETSNTDLHLLFRYFDVDVAQVSSDLTRAIDRLKTGNSRSPALSPKIVDLAREGFLIASIEYGATRARSGHLLLALLSDDALRLLAHQTSQEFAKISSEQLKKDMAAIIATSDEAAGEVEAATSPAGDPGQPVTGAGKTPALDQFTIDLTAQAKRGDIDPVLGRDAEIRQVIDILTRRRQNNPILTGEAGVGKTAVVEGFALRVAAKDVPPSLQNVSIRSLDLGLLQAGAGVKGEFENRLKSVIEEVKSSPTPIITFIDEAHTLIGAGGQAGQGDAANLLKPALARGELRTIAATTWAEYKKYFEKDAALTRRFQVVKVEEPSEAVCIEMMRGLVETLTRHHKVRILDEAVEDAVKLSHRYITGRQLPDKAVSLLDTACARVGISQSAVPPAVEDCRRRIDQLDTARAILNREAQTGGQHDTRLAEIDEEQAATKENLASLEARWEQEKELVAQLRDIYAQLEEALDQVDNAAAAADSTKAPASEKAATESAAPTGDAAKPAAPLTKAQQAELRSQLVRLSEELAALQGETPLIQVNVTGQTVAEVVSNWTGIPAGRMVANEIKTVLNLQELMEKRIVGQSHALNSIAQSIRTARANLVDPRKPIGVFMMPGPSGVGKTETALTLAELLYGGEQNLTVINMSEYKEEHKVSLLMGSPPGYVGYGEGGVLTEAVRRKPYSVVLLDEMEKAHPGVQDIFYQVFDKGMLRDGEGRDIDFKNTVIIMTSNAASDVIMKLCADEETRPDAAGLAEAIYPELLNTFKPAFLGRVTLTPYFPLTDDVMKSIIRLQLNRVAARIKANYRAVFEYGDDVVDSIAERCTEVESGARNVDHIVNRTLLPELSAEFLSRMADQQTVASVRVSMGDDGGFMYDIQ